jgi:hypothetical protein
LSTASRYLGGPEHVVRPVGIKITNSYLVTVFIPMEPAKDKRQWECMVEQTDGQEQPSILKRRDLGPYFFIEVSVPSQ